jgi:hypothetical protein
VEENMTETPVTGNTEGKKGVKLARTDLIPVKMIWLLAEVYGKGAAKYADRNWERGYEWSKSYQAAMRHLLQWWGGEQYDPDDGQHHLAAVIWHLSALIEFEDTHPELDNRPRKVELRSDVTNPEEIAAAKKEVNGHSTHEITTKDGSDSFDPFETSPQKRGKLMHAGSTTGNGGY